MIFLGLLLVLLAGAAAVVAITEESARYILFGYTFTPDHVEMFLAGAVSAALLVLGFWLIAAGSRRSARRRRRLAHVRADASDKVARLEDEKRELERKLEREHAATSKPIAGRTGKHADGHTDGHADGHVDGRTDDRLVAGREESKR
ncbi:hypothetical protein [Nonomuraea sp. SBT364]|uniref:hypothetical protein n=1 Tax=Nonomuraea sp. SBT364 TaxID=1580530 RepID=UPI00066C148B|nr:hypothetical protein [Nonomuraea sp. SBT364]